MRRFLLSVASLALSLAICSLARAQTPSTSFKASSPFGALAARDLKKLADGGRAVTPIPIPKAAPLNLVSPTAAPRPLPKSPTASFDSAAVRNAAAAGLVLRPDLLVTSAVVDGTRARIIVKNQGPGRAGENRLNLQAFRDSVLVVSEFVGIPAMDPGKSLPLSIEASPTPLDIPGTRLVFKVDDGSAIVEGDEANNVLVKVMPASVPPDLIIRKVDFLLGGNDIRVEVANVGQTAAKSFRVRRQFFKDGQDGGLGTVTVAGLAPGQARSVSFSASANPVDRMVITLDDLNQVSESNERNNVFVKVLP
jgi:hypothetical protein